MQVLRKRLSRTIENDRETIVNEYLKKELLSKEDIRFLEDYFDDPEDAFCNGLCYDLNDDLCYIDIERLADALDEQLKDEEIKEDLEESDIQTFKQILEQIIPWKSYDLWFE